MGGVTLAAFKIAECYRGHRFLAEVISYGVWLYYRFSLSFRDGEVLFAERGITVSYEAIRGRRFAGESAR